MKTRFGFALLLVAGLMILSTAFSQTPEKKAMVAIYHIAPGKHLDFLKWMAAQEAAAQEAKVPATQWYAHENGDSWDFVSIAPDLSEEQSAKVDAAAKAKGLKTGFAAALEFRQFVSSHSDTTARGPYTAAELVAMAGQ